MIDKDIQMYRILMQIITLGDHPFNMKGRGLWFFLGKTILSATLTENVPVPNMGRKKQARIYFTKLRQKYFRCAAKRKRKFRVTKTLLL